MNHTHSVRLSHFLPFPTSSPAPSSLATSVTPIHLPHLLSATGDHSGPTVGLLYTISSSICQRDHNLWVHLVSLSLYLSVCPFTLFSLYLITKKANIYCFALPILPLCPPVTMEDLPWFYSWLHELLHGPLAQSQPLGLSYAEFIR